MLHKNDLTELHLNGNMILARKMVIGNSQVRKFVRVSDGLYF